MPASIYDTPAAISGNEKFEATRKWRKALKNFHESMPLSTHRRQLRIYAETFTGKDALDLAEQIFPTIFPLCNNREKARQLLERFLCCEYITNVRDENCKDFADNAMLYRFCNGRIAQILNDEEEIGRRRNNLLARSSSVRDRNFMVQKERLQNDQSLSKTIVMREDFSKMSKLNGRLSISCQDISSLEKPTQQDTSTKKSSASIFNNLVNIGRASANLFSLNRSNSDTPRVRQRRCANASANDSRLFCDAHISLNNKRRIASHSVFKTTRSTNSHLLPQQIPSSFRTPMLSHSHISGQNRTDFWYQLSSLDCVLILHGSVDKIVCH